MALEFFQNYEHIGENRLCLHGEDYPHRYTDQWFNKLGIDSFHVFQIIMLSILYLKQNPELSGSLFGKIVNSIKIDLSENKFNASSRQIIVLKNFIRDDLKSLMLDFPHYLTIEREMSKVDNFIKCANNSHNNIVPELSEVFKEAMGG